jgi:hypothetical protein
MLDVLKFCVASIAAAVAHAFSQGEVPSGGVMQDMRCTLHVQQPATDIHHCTDAGSFI